MPQFFRIVGPHVDRVIAFDELPERLLVGVRHRECDGLPRHWLEKACNKKVVHIERQPPLKNEEKTVYFHYLIEYVRFTADIEKWQEINNFVRKATDNKVKLLDKLEDMALPMAPTFKDALVLEPEEVLQKALIPIPIEAQEKIITVENPITTTSESAPIILTTETGTTTGIVGKAKHSCKNKGSRGVYAPEGDCLRCDQLRAAKKQLVTA